MAVNNLLNAVSGLQLPSDSVTSLVWGYNWAQYNADRRLSDDSQRLFHQKDHLEVFQGPCPETRGPWNGELGIEDVLVYTAKKSQGPAFRL